MNVTEFQARMNSGPVFKITVGTKCEMDFFFIRVRTIISIMFHIMNVELESAGKIKDLFVVHLCENVTDIVEVRLILLRGFILSHDRELTVIVA